MKTEVLWWLEVVMTTALPDGRHKLPDGGEGRSEVKAKRQEVGTDRNCLLSKLSH